MDLMSVTSTFIFGNTFSKFRAENVPLFVFCSLLSPGVQHLRGRTCPQYSVECSVAVRINGSGYKDLCFGEPSV
jgi:hypothetical protein